MSFFERLVNTLMHFATKAFFHFYIFEPANAAYSELFNRTIDVKVRKL